MNISRIAISGASGLIGSALLQALASCELRQSTGSLANQPQLQLPLELFVMSRPKVSKSQRSKNSATKISEKKSRIQSIEWEPSQGVSNPTHLENMDAIIHLAGRPINARRWNRTERQRLRDSRVLSTRRLVEQIADLDSKPRVFLGASAVGLYGDCGDEWVSESRKAASDFLGQLAYDWEEAARPLEALGVRLVHARLGVVLATHGGALKKILPLFRLGLGGKLGCGKQFMSWISLHDCVRGFLFLLQHETAHGPFNLVSPQPVTNQEFTRELGNTLRRPTLFPAPKWALRMALGEMADALLLSSCRATPDKLQSLGFTFQNPDLRSCLQQCIDARSDNSAAIG